VFRLFSGLYIIAGAAGLRFARNKSDSAATGLRQTGERRHREADPVVAAFFIHF
jgi:hypothetical protein